MLRLSGSMNLRPIHFYFVTLCLNPVSTGLFYLVVTLAGGGYGNLP